MIKDLSDEKEVHVLATRGVNSAAEDGQAKLVLNVPFVASLFFGHWVANVLLEIEVEVGLVTRKMFQKIFCKLSLSVCRKFVP